MRMCSTFTLIKVHKITKQSHTVFLCKSLLSGEEKLRTKVGTAFVFCILLILISAFISTNTGNLMPVMS